MVRWPEGDLYSAAAMTSLISLMPARTALKETNSACVTRAMRRASVVLPQPGGPQNSIEPMLSLSICVRSEEHTSELQSRLHLVCRLLLEKKKIYSQMLYDIH